ncbi:GTPase HflX [Gracilariopsis chorda]|uniref:GTPase HflX n=1 Tax=Gracilariopsis chorda TaxID=448386 RepID=A0A2V3IVC2_9FLOR|nr:GTPase HflX [Gracilariopsis chorda]|eukprot:PXF45657.1 GTPase HflX [Gracilariopsis chorda]
MEQQTAFVSPFTARCPSLLRNELSSFRPSVRALRPPSAGAARVSHDKRAIRMSEGRRESAEERLSLRVRREQERELCVLVGVDVTARDAQRRLFSIDESLQELTRLAETAGMRVVSVVTQQLAVPFNSTYIGTGKVVEVRQQMESVGCHTCIFDVELSPAQQRTLEREFGGEARGIKVLDRTALILDIFAQHAATREGQLQVELALYQYRLPRLTRMWTHLERQSGAGGVGLRGPGETQLEVDRRMINSRVNKLKKQLESVRAHRTRARQARKRNVGLPVVALIGYTNSGKSSLLNALSGADALAANALFATLDPTTRRAKLDGLKLSPEVLLTDTVGFVQNLPTQLVAAFRATLEEVVDADMLVHVVDGSEDMQVLKSKMEAVERVVEQIGAGGKPTVVAVNKADLVAAEGVAKVKEAIEGGSTWESVVVSAKTGRDWTSSGL